MNKTINNFCGRGEELVAYMYDEAQPAEARTFERHLDACAACREELAAFGSIREGVGEWRAAVLKGAPGVALAGELARPSSQAAPRPERDWRRALAALREFFTRSPVWLQAGTMAATLVVCALAALAVARAEVRWDESGLAVNAGPGTRSPANVPPAPVERSDTRQEVEQLNARLSATSQQLEETRTQLQTAQRQIALAGVEANNTPVVGDAAARNEPKRKRRATPAPRSEEAKLSRDLNRDDEELPTLLDLLGETD